MSMNREGRPTRPEEAAGPEGKTWTGNLCAQCGGYTLVYEEGCKKCHACGYSEC